MQLPFLLFFPPFPASSCPFHVFIKRTNLLGRCPRSYNFHCKREQLLAILGDGISHFSGCKLSVLNISSQFYSYEWGDSHFSVYVELDIPRWLLFNSKLKCRVVQKQNYSCKSCCKLPWQVVCFRFTRLKVSGPQIFQNPRRYLKILFVKKFTWSKFHTEDL